MFELMNVIWSQRKKILIFSHLIMIMNTVNLVLAIYNNNVSMYNFTIWIWITGLVSFVILQVTLRDYSEE